jgi:hypothetical protein
MIPEAFQLLHTGTFSIWRGSRMIVPEIFAKGPPLGSESSDRRSRLSTAQKGGASSQLPNVALSFQRRRLTFEGRSLKSRRFATADRRERLSLLGQARCAWMRLPSLAL